MFNAIQVKQITVQNAKCKKKKKKKNMFPCYTGISIVLCNFCNLLLFIFFVVVVVVVFFGSDTKSLLCLGIETH